MYIAGGLKSASTGEGLPQKSPSKVTYLGECQKLGGGRISPQATLTDIDRLLELPQPHSSSGPPESRLPLRNSVTEEETSGSWTGVMQCKIVNVCILNA